MSNVFSEFVAQIVASGKATIVKAPLGCGKVAMCMMAAKKLVLDFVSAQSGLITLTELSKIESRAGQMLALVGFEKPTDEFRKQIVRLLTNVPDGAKVLLCLDTFSDADYQLPIIELKFDGDRDEWSVELLTSKS